MMTNKMLMNLNHNLRRLDKIQQKWATGKNFNVPSDNPIGVAKSLELTTAIARLGQYKKNAEDALSWLEITESAIDDVGSILQRARELAVSADGTETPEDKQKVQAEIDQLTEQLLQLANTTYAGKSIFTGYKTNQKLLDDDGTYHIDSKSDERMIYELGIGERIEINVLGHELFGIYDSASPDLDAVNRGEAQAGTHQSQLIAVLKDFSDALQNDDMDRINKTIERIDKHLENILSLRGEIGAKTNRLEMTIDRIEKDTLNFRELLSNNEDADMAEVIMNFKMDETVYRASLSSAARIIQPSLVDFLR